MQRRHLWIVCFFLFVAFLSYTENAHSYFQLYRMPQKMNVLPKHKQVENFVKAWKAGNTKIFQYVEYELLRGESTVEEKENVVPVLSGDAKDYTRGVVSYIAEKANEDKKYYIEWLTEDGKIRDKIIQGALAGLLNLDPRVRMTAIHFLRRLKPDSSMQLAVKRALAMETVAGQWEYWREKDVDIPSSENPWLEGVFWDEDESFWDNTFANGYEQEHGAVKSAYRAYEDRDKPPLDHLWAHQFGGNNGVKIGASNYSATGSASSGVMNQYEDTKHLYSSNKGFSVSGSKWQEGDAAQPNPSLKQGYEYNGANYLKVPIGGSWYRINDDIKNYQGEGDNRLKYRFIKPLFKNVAGIDDKDKNTTAYYSFVEIFGNPAAELHKLDLFITRTVWYNKLKKKDANAIIVMSKDTFRSLFLSIDGESAEQIPFPSTATKKPMFDASDVDVLIQGLHHNKVVTNRWIIAKALKYIYVNKNTPVDTKKKILKAILKAKYNENKIDIYRGDELYRELVEETIREEQESVAGAGVGAGEGFYLGLKANHLFNPDVDEKDSPVVADASADRRSIASVELVEKSFDASGQQYTDVAGNPIKQKVYVAKGFISHRDEMDKALKENGENEVTPIEAQKAQFIIDMFRYGTPSIQSENVVYSIKDAPYEVIRNAIIMTLYRMQTDTMVARGDAADTKTDITAIQELYTKVKNSANVADKKTALDELNAKYILADANLVKFGSGKLNKIAFPRFFSSLRGETEKPSEDVVTLRRNVIKTALAGLENNDPRVRLTCIHFLRRCAIDVSMMPDVKKALEKETVDYNTKLLITSPSKKDDYGVNSFGDQFVDQGLNEFVDIFGIVQNKEANKELKKLRKFIVRTILITTLEEGSVTVRDTDDKVIWELKASDLLAKVSRDQFKTFTETIDDENPARVPFLLVSTNDIPLKKIDAANYQTNPEDLIIKPEMIKFIVKGLDSFNFLNQKETAEFLINYYNTFVSFDFDKWQVDKAKSNAKLSSNIRNTILDAIISGIEDDVIIEQADICSTHESVEGRAVIKIDDKKEVPLDKILIPRKEWEYAKTFVDQNKCILK